MDFILIEYIDNKKYGKLAHFIDEEDRDVYSKVLEDNDTIYYQELSEEEIKEVKSMIKDEE